MTSRRKSRGTMPPLPPNIGRGGFMFFTDIDHARNIDDVKVFVVDKKNMKLTGRYPLKDCLRKFGR